MLVERNLKIRYKNSFLGFFWSLGSPVFMILIYALFLRVIRFEIKLPVLVSGIIVWQFLAMCMGDALHAVVGNANLVTKAAFPRLILPCATVGANLINFLLSCLVLLGYLLVAGSRFGPVYWFPLILLTHLALCLGVALAIASVNVFFRDTEHLLSVVMLAWFFMTPVIYPVTMVTDELPAWTHWLYFANPMAGIVSAYRTAFISAPAMPAGLTTLSFGMAWLVLAAGYAIFQAGQAGFSDEL